ncbi:unnamed protein product [Urochloa decumbens]|uniref:Phorbol-ester/DAG-type domain-containing protein n=1 Tax=Urochloa decumbens TaxID=240449 RepID=A0ABC9G0P2_9POAL
MAPYQPSNSDHLRHFADPHHPLVKTQYSHDQTGLCSICLLKLAGVHGYGCYHCNIHVHRECAGHFKETVSFFAHPAHTLKLRRSPGRVCNICRGDCPQNSFVYSCIECDFDVHPLCALLPERVAGGGGASHPWRDLRMVSSSSAGSCSECHHPLPTWRYVCSSLGLQLHVTCAIPIDPAVKGAQGSSHGATCRQRSVGDPAGQGWYYGHATPGYYNAAAFQAYGGPTGHGGYFGGGPVMQGGYGYPIQQGSYYYPTATAMPAGGGHGGAAGSSGHSSIFGSSSGMMTGIAGFLASAAINTVASDFASLLLSAVFGC